MEAERKTKMKIFNGFSFKKQLLLGSNWAKVLECGSKILLIVLGNHLSVFFFKFGNCIICSQNSPAQIMQDNGTISVKKSD